MCLIARYMSRPYFMGIGEAATESIGGFQERTASSIFVHTQ